MKPSKTSFPSWIAVDDGPERVPRAWPRYMTARVAADYADSSRWTIRRNVNPCGRRGRSFVYSIESVEAWMRGTSVAAGGAIATRVNHDEPRLVALAGRKHDVAA